MQKDYVRSLFNGIAARYDLLNHLLSGGIDHYWRWRAIRRLRPLRPRRILDVATGTADFAIAALRLDPEEVVGVDIAEEMIERGRKKISRRGIGERIRLLPGDAESLPFPAESFDAAIVAFGVRNFEHLESGLAGMHRTLRPGGEIVVLEFSRPQRPPFRQIYFFYFRRLLPVVGRLVSNHPEAYTYLPETVMRFPEGGDFLAILGRVGFVECSATRLTGGIATIYSGTKR
jgi:demethylmenaquinone methyltransferase/2-methoxy-6-polyprenyl-1,4-benzoquinol methylase